MGSIRAIFHQYIYIFNYLRHGLWRPDRVRSLSILLGVGPEDEGLQVGQPRTADPLIKFKNPEDSGLTVTVEVGSKDLEPYLLTSDTAG